MSSTVCISCTELCSAEGVSEAFILEAIEHGIINPLEGTQMNDWVFAISEVSWFKKALRLQKDLELDWVAVALVIELLQSKESLEQENQLLRQRLERFYSE